MKNFSWRKSLFKILFIKKLSFDHIVLIFSGFRRGIQPYPQTMFTLMEALKSLAPWFTAAVVVLLSPMVKDLIPTAVSNYLFSIISRGIFRRLTVIEIYEFVYGTRNQVYDAAATYLRKKINDSPKPKRFACAKTIQQKKPICNIAMEEEFIDNFGDIRLKWKSCSEKYEHPDSGTHYFYELTFDKRFEKDVVEAYLPYVFDCAEEIRREEKVIHLCGNNCRPDGPGREWLSTILEHPATFDKLAMSPELKRSLKDDLDMFVNRKEWYKKVGRAWKRGYLVYGPPGTGKSSLIAAMANYLKFDIYYLDISNIKSDSALRNMLLSTFNRSMIVIEDIDCAQLEKRGEEKKDSYYKVCILYSLKT